MGGILRRLCARARGIFHALARHSIRGLSMPSLCFPLPPPPPPHFPSGLTSPSAQTARPSFRGCLPSLEPSPSIDSAHFSPLLASAPISSRPAAPSLSPALRKLKLPVRSLPPIAPLPPLVIPTHLPPSPRPTLYHSHPPPPPPSSTFPSPFHVWCGGEAVSLGRG